MLTTTPRFKPIEGAVPRPITWARIAIRRDEHRRLVGSDVERTLTSDGAAIVFAIPTPPSAPQLRGISRVDDPDERCTRRGSPGASSHATTAHGRELRSSRPTSGVSRPCRCTRRSPACRRRRDRELEIGRPAALVWHVRHADRLREPTLAEGCSWSGDDRQIADVLAGGSSTTPASSTRKMPSDALSTWPTLRTSTTSRSEDAADAPRRSRDALDCA
jgi:hypothetical protein